MEKKDIKKGMIFKSSTSDKRIKVIKKYGGNGHWVVKNLGGNKKSQTVHEGTLIKFYNLEK
jgi:hypothetical protein